MNFQKNEVIVLKKDMQVAFAIVAAAAAVVAVAVVVFDATAVGGDLAVEYVDVVVVVDDVSVAVALERNLAVLNVLFQKEHQKFLNQKYYWG